MTPPRAATSPVRRRPGMSPSNRLRDPEGHARLPSSQTINRTPDRATRPPPPQSTHRSTHSNQLHPSLTRTQHRPAHTTQAGSHAASPAPPPDLHQDGERVLILDDRPPVARDLRTARPAQMDRDRPSTAMYRDGRAYGDIDIGRAAARRAGSAVRACVLSE